MRLYYTLTTLEPVIVSKTTATTNHQGLDHIPGSAILGMVASTLYPKLRDEKDLTWSLFHSGEVQYGPCYPLIENSLCLPTPASWHYEKGKQAIENEQYQHSEISNHSSYEFQRADAVQYKQCRDGFVSGEGLAAVCKQGLTTKTAINRENGSVKQGSLFSYSYIQENQKFGGWIECENQQHLDIIKKQLLGERHIGRSRSAEFGRVVIEEANAGSSLASDKISDTLVVWCLSDCEVLDVNGIPTLTPELMDLVEGASGSLNRDKSFIRQDKISRFNQARSGIDSEQIVITKGSVLVFDDVQISEKSTELMVQKGIGVNRQQGLGWVAINPGWAAHSGLSKQLFKAIELKVNQQRQKAAIETKKQKVTPLTQWLQAKMDFDKNQTTINDNSQQQIKMLLEHYQAFRAYNHIMPGYAIGPSNTQWSRVRETLKSKPENWHDLLFKDRHNQKSSAVCKVVNDDQGWGVTWIQNNQYITLADVCAELFKVNELDSVFLTIEKISRYDLADYKECKRAAEELLGEKI
jgi:CRISPR-associated protein Csx10